jgi:hypothetical protein
MATDRPRDWRDVSVQSLPRLDLCSLPRRKVKHCCLNLEFAIGHNIAFIYIHVLSELYIAVYALNW